MSLKHDWFKIAYMGAGALVVFINEELRERFSDLIYRIKIANKDAYIVFLLEHKSYKDKLAIFQISKYILELWMTIVQKENSEELPIIIPMLIYHGREKWNLKTNLRDMIPGFYDYPEYFRERVPVFKYDFYNIAEYRESDFEKLTRLTAMMLRAFKYSFEKDLEVVLRNFLIALEDTLGEEPTETVIYYGELYLRYIEATNAGITEDDIRNEIKKLDGKGAITMSILQKREEKGRREGLEQVANNLLKEGMEIALVAKTTGLSRSEVERIKEKLDISRE